MKKTIITQILYEFEMTQGEFAKRTNISQSKISGLNTNRLNPTIEEKQIIKTFIESNDIVFDLNFWSSYNKWKTCD